MAARMANPRARPTARVPKATRVSVSLPPEVARTLQDIARQRRVSLAWVVRDAAERYLAEQWPLFGTPRGAAP